MVGRREVADAAGVSVRTVSNVVTGFPHVAPETRERVLRAIAELEYRPSEVARTLRSGRTGLVGLVLPELDTPYFAELTRAFVEEGRRRGLTVVIDQTDGDRQRELALIERTADGGLFDALVISPLGLRPDDVDAERPIVFLGEQRFPRFDQVAIDNAAAVHDVVAHLRASGRTRIAAIGAERSGHAASAVRLAAFGDMGRVEFVDSYRRAEGAAAMARLLDTGERPDAVFCFSDPLALGALRTLLSRGIRVPHDIALVGFDDIEDGAFATPSLTTITPDRAFLARAALERVEARLAGVIDEPTLIVAPHHLTMRESG